jgi:glycerol-3-phosphate acyltransferase PlsY
MFEGLPSPLLSVTLIVGGYLLGSISTAIVTCRLMGLPDPRVSGSGNPGATNVLRVGGKRAAAITLFGDMLKGLIPVLIAQLLGASMPVVAATGLAAFLGHLYPVFFAFQGGKGVATLLGVLLGLHWLAGLATIVTWLAVAAIWRISSLSALVAAALSPIYVWQTTGSTLAAAVVLLMAAILYWRHRENIRRIAAGTEGRIGTDR